MIKEITSDIFQAPIDVLVHQANCFHTMGDGVAKLIKDAFPEAYEEDCKTNAGDVNKLGTFSIAKIKEPKSRIKYVVNLYSQYGFGRDKRYTQYDAMVKGLEKLRDGMINKKTNESYTIGFPYKMGCMLGGGNWPVVEAIIHEVFEEYPFQILICKLPV